MALWENLKGKLPLEGTYIEIPHRFEVTIKQMEISDTLVSFKLFNTVKGEFTISCDRKLLNISPNGEQLQINAQYCWSLLLHPKNTQEVLQHCMTCGKELHWDNKTESWIKCPVCKHQDSHHDKSSKNTELETISGFQKFPNFPKTVKDERKQDNP